MKRMPITDPNELVEAGYVQNELEVGNRYFRALMADPRFPEAAKASKSRTFYKRADVERFKSQIEQDRRAERLP